MTSMPPEEGRPLGDRKRTRDLAAQRSPSSAARTLLEKLFRDALHTVESTNLVRARSTFDGRRWRYRSGENEFIFDIPQDGRLLVVGAGKAAASVALGLEFVLGARIDDGCIIVKYGHTKALSRIRQYEAGHPVPDARGVDATRRLVSMLEGLTSSDRVIVILTGGASALLVDPVDGVSLDDKALTTSLLLNCGAPIAEVNAVRKALSNVKGGALLSRIAPASSVTLLVSDVPGGDFGTIGSGPTIPERGGGLDALDILRRYGLIGRLPETVIAAARRPKAFRGRDAPIKGCHDVLLLAESADIVRSVTALAAKAGLECRIVNPRMDGKTHDEARSFALAVRQAVAGRKQRLLLVCAGETTLEVTGTGKGGRNQEFALLAAGLFEGVPGVTVLAAGTDGSDGPTDAAGAIVDGSTWSFARAAGFDPATALANNDSYPLLDELGALLMTGPTGTNLMDMALALIDGEASATCN